MAYTFSASLSVVVQDGNGGQQSIVISSGDIVPTKPAFCGSGTATTTPPAITFGSVTTPKALVFINDGAQDITVDVGTDTHVVKAAAATTGPFLPRSSHAGQCSQRFNRIQHFRLSHPHRGVNHGPFPRPY
jgi:hypothetical protein